MAGTYGGYFEGGAMTGITGFGPGTPVEPYGELGLTGGVHFRDLGLDLSGEVAAGGSEAIPGLDASPPTWLRFGVVVTGSF